MIADLEQPRASLPARNIYRPRYLRRWERTAKYVGPSYSDWFVVCELYADSGAKERSNYAAAERLLRNGTPERFSELIMNAKFTDAKARWRRKLMVHASCAPGLRVADELSDQMQRHEVLDPEAHEHYLKNEITAAWAKLDRRERIQLCWEAGISIFIARRDAFPVHDPDIRGALADAIGRG